MVAAAVVLAPLALPALPGAGSPQRQSQGCAWQLDSVGGSGKYLDLGSGRVHQHASGGVWASCGPTRMFAESVASYSEVDRVDFVGRVNFRDSVVRLDTDRASYFLRHERVEAYGNVRLVNRRTGSELRGPQLTYWRAVPGTRDSAELYAEGRPTVRYRADTDTAGAEPYVIVAQRVRMLGESATWAGGNVTVDRSDLKAAADSAALQLERGVVEFLGKARVSSEGWQLTSDTIHFLLVNDRIQSGVAWGDSSRPALASEGYDMTADSLAFDAPEQALDEIRGFGKARAIAHADSTVDEPDWVAGDTLVARFDTAGTGGKRTLQTLEARGKAQAFYRVYEDDGQTLAGINYSRGTRILALFREDGIERVHVMGESDGVYLEPVRRRPPP